MNFGEIEMCNEKKIDYNIKIKSNNCELYIFRKKVKNTHKN